MILNYYAGLLAGADALEVLRVQAVKHAQARDDKRPGIRTLHPTEEVCGQLIGIEGDCAVVRYGDGEICRWPLDEVFDPGAAAEYLQSVRMIDSVLFFELDQPDGRALRLHTMKSKDAILLYAPGWPKPPEPGLSEFAGGPPC